MINFLADWYLWLKALHIISVIAWMAGLFYLPRLYVYHTRVKPGSEQDKLFQVMELKLLRIIMAPASVLTWVFGLALVFVYGWDAFFDSGWGWVKLIAVIALTWFHHTLARYRKAFAVGKNTRPEKYYRLINEVPTVLMIIIVFMVVLQPF